MASSHGHGRTAKPRTFKVNKYPSQIQNPLNYAANVQN
jgi:hypothetical protein